MRKPRTDDERQRFNANRNQLRDNRRKAGLCCECGQTRPMLHPKRYPKPYRSRNQSKRTKYLLNKIKRLHPDANGGKSPNDKALHRAIVQLKNPRSYRVEIRVEPGFSVFARGVWWKAIRRVRQGFWECHRKQSDTYHGGCYEMTTNIAIAEMTDSRCGPDAAFRMISVRPGRFGGLRLDRKLFGNVG